MSRKEGRERVNTSDPKQQNIKKSIMTRVQVLYVLFAVAAVAIFAMILITQYGPNGTPLRNRSDLKCYKTLHVPSSRGNIYSHNGLIMATDSPSYHISLDFTVLDMEDEEFNSLSKALADSLSRVIPEYSKDYFARRLKEIRTTALKGGPGSQNQKLMKETVNQLQLDRMKTFPIFNKGRLGGGFIYTQDAERYKPFGTLAARTLGKPGEFGLEASFNDVLTGSDGSNLCVRLVRDIWVPMVDADNVEAVNGRDIVTTIDVLMQDIVETELRKQILSNNADCGTAIIMEVETGEIRAISNLTRYGNIVRDDVNHAITMRCEPGSTFKLVSLMALIEEAGYSLDYPVDCTESGVYNYQARPGGRKYIVKDSHSVGKTDIRGMMEHSSNIGFVKVIDNEYRNSPERFVDFIYSLGIDRPIDMQLYGGLRPIIKDPRRPRETAWDAISLMKMSYGYAIELTPIHTLMLYNAVANNGVMVAPRLVTAILENDKEVETFDIEVLNEQICSERTVKLIHETLVGVVENGTGKVVKNPNYSVAGKTGTAQIAMKNKGYMDASGGRDYLGTFVGYFPADKPRYSCIVAIKTYNGPGRRNAFYGSALAGPAFRAIADRVYALDAEVLIPLPSENTESVATVKGGSIEDIQMASAMLSIPASIGYGGYEWGITESDIRKVDVSPITLIEETMPSVKGMALKDALFLLERQGLRVNFSGIGKVVSQSIAEGEPISEGMTVKLILQP